MKWLQVQAYLFLPINEKDQTRACNKTRLTIRWLPDQDYWGNWGRGFQKNKLNNSEVYQKQREEAADKPEAEAVESAVDETVGETNHLKLYSLPIGVDVLTCPLFEISQLIFVLHWVPSIFI